jgi:hypothetical protein
VLLVKNIFQRNFPEIHFDPDIRPVKWEHVQAEIKRLKIKLQKSLEQMEGNVQQLLSEKELHAVTKRKARRGRKSRGCQLL